MQLDALDQIAAKAFEGYLVRKDLVRQFKGQYPVPAYVANFFSGDIVPVSTRLKSRKDSPSSNGNWPVGQSEQERKNYSKPGPENRDA